MRSLVFPSHNCFLFVLPCVLFVDSIPCYHMLIMIMFLCDMRQSIFSCIYHLIKANVYRSFVCLKFILNCQLLHVASWYSTNAIIINILKIFVNSNNIVSSRNYISHTFLLFPTISHYSGSPSGSFQSTCNHGNTW